MTARAGLVAVVRGLAVLAAAHAMLRVAGTLLVSGDVERGGGRGLLPTLLADPVMHLLVASAAFAAAPWLAARVLPADAPLSPRALGTWVGVCAFLVAVDLGLRFGAGWVAWSFFDPFHELGWSPHPSVASVVQLVLCAGIAIAAWVGPDRSARAVARWFDRWFRASRPRPDVAP